MPTLTSTLTSDSARDEYRRERMAHWDRLAREDRGKTGAYYHRRLIEIYRHLVAPGQRVLEVGCGAGDLLAALEPAEGVGVDFSGEMVRIARDRHPELIIVQQD